VEIPAQWGAGKINEIMLQQFTWLQFLIAALILSLIWYVTILLLFYRKDLYAILTNRKNVKSSKEPLPHIWENEFDELTPDDPMGKPASPEGLTTVNMSEFSFGQKENASKFQQLGIVPDLLEELKTIFNILQKEDGTKADFFSLLALTKAKHPKIGSNPNIQYITDFVRDHVPFMLTQQELENLWD
jgi:hypothetical protein